jgi:hypothetical protein
MTTRRVRPDNSIPLIVGAIYQLTPDMGGNYVTIVDITRRYVYFAGVDNTIADWRLPVWKADDVLIKRIDGVLPGSDSFLLLTTGFYLLLTDGGRLRLHT